MPQSDFSTGAGDEPIRRIADELGVPQLVEVATAVRSCAGSTAARRYGDTAAALAALVVASRRCLEPDLSPTTASERVDADATAVRRAVDVFEAKLAPPAAEDERRRLRQTIVAIDELLAAIEAGRSNPPRLSGPGFERADPGVLAEAARPIDELDAEALRRDRRRFAADLTLARLGVELFAHVQVGSEPDR